MKWVKGDKSNLDGIFIILLRTLHRLDKLCWKNVLDWTLIFVDKYNIVMRTIQRDQNRSLLSFIKAMVLPNKLQ